MTTFESDAVRPNVLDPEAYKRRQEYVKQNAVPVTEILENALQVDDYILKKQAEKSFKELQQQNFSVLLVSLSCEFANDEKNVEIRQLAGLVLKDALDAKCDQNRKKDLVQRWLLVDTTAKEQTKFLLRQLFISPLLVLRSMASQVVAKVVVIELPDNQWPEPLNFLLSHHRIFSIDTRQAVFNAVGYLCEEISSGDIHQGQLHELLSFAYQGMCYDRRNTEIVKLAPIRAVSNLLPFAHTMLSDSFESSDIMELGCEAALSSEVKIRQTALECLVYIASYFHSERVPELKEIFDITTKAVKEDEEPVAVQAIRLWSTICCKGIVLEDIDKQLLCNLVPLLLETLLKQEEDQDQVEDSSKLAVAGRICLGHVARAIGDDIFPLVMPFIEENITKPDWRQRNAAEKALLLIQGELSSDKRRLMFNIGCGSTPCALMEDFNSHSKDYSAWALGQEFKHIEF